MVLKFKRTEILNSISCDPKYSQNYYEYEDELMFQK